MGTQNTSALAQILTQHASCDAGFLNLKDAAAYLKRTPEWLRLQNKAGTAPPSIKVGRERRYLKADLDAWLAQRGRK